MKLVTYSDKSVLLGDEAADYLVRFAAFIADKGRAEAISLNVIASDGELIVTSFVLGTGIGLMAESTASALPEPDNRECIDYMNDKMELLTAPSRAIPAAEPWPTDDGLGDSL
ncbi:hypothetical protein [Conyzicola sp.]|uniref:hypothetical protein n=1 Tax=Conyzicola sp. TaxID=1969404 RepID=UPI00398A13C5